MMRRILCLAAVFGSLAGSASAQTNACDSPWPTTQSVTPSVPYRLQVCAPDLITEATLFVNGTARPRESLTRVQGPNAAGLSLYDGTVDVALTQGAPYSLQAILWRGSVEVTRTGILSVQAGSVTPAPTPAPVPTPQPSWRCTVPAAPSTYANGDKKYTLRCPSVTPVVKGNTVTVTR